MNACVVCGYEHLLPSCERQVFERLREKEPVRSVARRYGITHDQVRRIFRYLCAPGFSRWPRRPDVQA